MATVGLAVMLFVTVRPGGLGVVVLSALGLCWSTASVSADLLSRLAARRARDAAHDPGEPNPAAAGGTVTTIVRLRDEPTDLARAAILLALEAGPVRIVIEDGRDIAEELAALAPVHRAASVNEAVRAATTDIDTDAVLLVSGRAFPDPGACRSVAGLLTEEVAWVTGSSASLTAEGFAPDTRATVDRALRSRARAGGLELWEPDATLVRTDVLRAHPNAPERPWGAWLRERHAEGLRGRSVQRVLSYRSTPLDPESFWPDAIARQRGAAAELADSVTTGPAHRRAIGALLLARELRSVQLAAWLTIPLMLDSSGAFPVDLPPLPTLAAALALVGLRWATLRAALGVRTRPYDDVVAEVHHLPGSVAAIPAVFHQDVRTLRASVPTRPLVWAALVAVLVVGATLVDHDPSRPVPKLTVGAAIATLGLLWAFTMRSLVQRSWSRRTHRVPIDIDVRVDGRPARSLDGSPDGIAVTVGEADDLRTGGEVEVELRPDGRPPMHVRATVATCRPRGDSTLLGLELHLEPEQRRGWLTTIFDALDPAGGPVAPPRPHREPGDPLSGSVRPGGRLERLGERVLHGVVVTVSLAIVGLLVLVSLGYRPLVVRSASMVPTLGVGDVVFAEQVLASDLVPGDIVTQPDRVAHEAMTHRVVSVAPGGDGLVFVTRGDANDSDETWTVRADELVGRTRWSIPRVGTLASQLRGSIAILGSVVAATALGASMFRTRRVRAPAA